MRTRVKKSDFVNAASASVAAVSKRTTIPILSHIRIFGEPGGPLRITGTDQEVGVTVVCPAEVGSPIDGTVDGSRILSVFRSLPEGDSEIEFQENGYLLVSFGRSNIKVVGLSPKDYPHVPPPPESGSTEIVIPSDTLDDILNCVSFAASTNPQFMHLNGLCLSEDDGFLRVSATDGMARMSVIKTKLDVSRFDPVTIPVRAIQIMQKASELGGSVTMVVGQGSDDRQACWIKDELGGVVFARLYEAEFPLGAMDQVFRGGFEHTCVIDRENFISALRRSSVISDHGVIELSYRKKEVVVSAVTATNGESADYVDCLYDGPEFSTGMQSAHLMAALSATPGGDVVIKFDKFSKHLISSPENEGHESIVAPYVIG